MIRVVQAPIDESLRLVLDIIFAYKASRGNIQDQSMMM